MTIPFIKMENGKRGAVRIERSATVENQANTFLDAGGRYLIETCTDGKIHLMAIIDTANGCEKVAEQTQENGPDLPLAVDLLVTESVNHLPPHVPEVRRKLILPRGHANGNALR